VFGFKKGKLSSRGKKMKKTKYENKDMQKMYKLLTNIIEKIKKEKDYSSLKQEVLNLSNEWNKELLFDDFIKKVEIFYSYDEKETEVFPIKPWVDSFFES
jgi:predicted patatin/cPLA2 family phospholipase